MRYCTNLPLCSFLLWKFLSFLKVFNLRWFVCFSASLFADFLGQQRFGDEFVRDAVCCGSFSTSLLAVWGVGLSDSSKSDVSIISRNVDGIKITVNHLFFNLLTVHNYKRFRNMYTATACSSQIILPITSFFKWHHEFFEFYCISTGWLISTPITLESWFVSSK